MSDAMPVLLDRRSARIAGTALASLRVAIGVGAMLAPRLLLRPWAGGDIADRPSAPLLGRAIGGRDLALGVGALVAMREDGPARGWIEAGALADTGDTVGMVLSFRRLPSATRWAILALTLGAIAAGGIIAPAIDQED